MKKITNIILEQIVDRKAGEFSLEREKRNHTGSVVSIFQEDWHLFSYLNHPLVPSLEIQCSISMEGDFIRTVWFPHPTLITPEIRTDFILLANEANLELYSGGRFWCNEEMDFAYEIVLAEEVIEKCEDEAARQIFDIPYTNFKDLHTPLIMLSNGKWKADTAVRYLTELKEKGYVDNSDYDLW